MVNEIKHGRCCGVEIAGTAENLLFYSRDVCSLLGYEEDGEKVVLRLLDKEDYCGQGFYVNIFGLSELVRLSDYRDKSGFKKKIISNIIPYAYGAFDVKPLFVSKSIQSWLKDGNFDCGVYYGTTMIYFLYEKYCKLNEIKKVSYEHFFKVMETNNLWERDKDGRDYRIVKNKYIY